MGNQATCLRPQVLSDLVESTELDANVIRSYYRQFSRECETGQLGLDLDSFRKVYTELFPGGDPTNFADHVFRVFDQDGNGEIDFREFMMAVSIQQKGSYEDRLRWLFNMFDLDGTGNISLDELETLISALRRLHGHDLDGDGTSETAVAEIAKHIMAKTDKDKDRVLSEREFVEGALVSTTMESLMKGALSASSSPFTPRRARAYSNPPHVTNVTRNATK